jgi:hypothetical protein
MKRKEKRMGQTMELCAASRGHQAKAAHTTTTTTTMFKRARKCIIMGPGDRLVVYGMVVHLLQVMSL